jgi:hypothetical protein
MKNSIKILMMAVVFAIAAGCSEDATFSPGPESKHTQNVFFPTVNYKIGEMEPSQPTEFTITVNRTESGAAITVPVTITGTDPSVFTATPISFAADQTETTFTVSFPNAEIGKEYTCTITISDPTYYNTYGTLANMNTTFSFIRMKWDDWARGTYTTALPPFPTKTFEQVLQKVDGENRFRFANRFVEGYHYVFNWNITEKELSIMPIGTAVPSSVFGAPVIYQDTGLHLMEGEIARDILQFTDYDVDYTYYDPATKTLTINSYNGIIRAESGAIAGWGWLDDTFVISEFLMGNPWEE